MILVASYVTWSFVKFLSEPGSMSRGISLRLATKNIMAFLLHFRILLSNYENNACQSSIYFVTVILGCLGCIFKLVQRTISNITWYFYIFLSNSKQKLHNLFHLLSSSQRAFPGGSAGKESACNAGDLGLIPGFGRFPGEGTVYATPVFLPGKFHGKRSLVGYRSWDHRVGCVWETNTHCRSHKDTYMFSKFQVAIQILFVIFSSNRTKMSSISFTLEVIS